MINKIIAINGQFLARTMTGLERFAYEIVLELDKLVDKDIIEIVVPKHAQNIPELINIKVVKYGKIRSPLWEQTNFAFYCISRKALSLNLCSTVPLLKPGIVCIHDLSYKVNPQFFKTKYAIISKWWHKIHYWAGWLFSPLVYTVSEYSKRQMVDIYNVNPKKIHVIHNGWQHFLRVKYDDSIFDIYPELKKERYFFTLGRLSPNKNIEWVLKAARMNPQYQFAIAGNTNLQSYGKDYSESNLPNVRFLGYITDGHIKSLMRDCRAFIFPSRYEGFGIPPLEAMSVGARVIVSNVSCLPEIYGKSAYYIDPDICVSLDELLSNPVSDSKEILEKYSFKNSAKVIWADLEAIVFHSEKTENTYG